MISFPIMGWTRLPLVLGYEESQVQTNIKLLIGSEGGTQTFGFRPGRWRSVSRWSSDFQ